MCRVIGQAGAGASCTSTNLNYQECAAGLFCNRPSDFEVGTCIAPYSRAQSESCTYSFHCQAGLACTSMVCTPPPVTCVHDGDCGVGTCSCTGQCVARAVTTPSPDPCFDTWTVSRGTAFTIDQRTLRRTWSILDASSTCNACIVATPNHFISNLRCARPKSQRTFAVHFIVPKSPLVACHTRPSCSIAAHRRYSGSKSRQ
jgi:hypothetical protein